MSAEGKNHPLLRNIELDCKLFIFRVWVACSFVLSITSRSEARLEQELNRLLYFRCLLLHGQYRHQLGISLQGSQREREIHGSASGTSVLWADLEVYKRNCSFQIEACKHTPGGCLFFSEGGSLSPHPVTPCPSLMVKCFLEFLS